ncbi:gag-pol polyprotein [Lasius niger]|uniref:Gag-pol polyprotein n=1 Tax=Lasius niger TaxID=67767 RepID=A0A0J7KPD1_LASNI|nr:gag-pol polyprotein [Lasius niger]
MDPGCFAKAKALQDQLKAILPEEKANVARPMKTGELRFIGLDIAATSDEVADFIVENGKCGKEDIKVSEIQAMRNGLYTVWARCPLAVAVYIAKMRKARIGWTFSRIEMLETRPTQCFRCWGFGHVRYSCSSNIDRSRACFNYGMEGHALRAFTRPSRCVVCEAEGRTSDHRLGSASCKMDRKQSKPRPKPRSSAVTPGRRTGDNIGIVSNA